MLSTYSSTRGAHISSCLSLASLRRAAVNTAMLFEAQHTPSSEEHRHGEMSPQSVQTKSVFNILKLHLCWFRTLHSPDRLLRRRFFTRTQSPESRIWFGNVCNIHSVPAEKISLTSVQVSFLPEFAKICVVQALLAQHSSPNPADLAQVSMQDACDEERLCSKFSAM